MNAGSAADVMQYAWAGGMEEEVVRCILRQALEGLKQVLHLPPLSLSLNLSLVVISISMVSFTGTLKQQISSLTMMVPSCLVILASLHP